MSRSTSMDVHHDQRQAVSQERVIDVTDLRLERQQALAMGADGDGHQSREQRVVSSATFKGTGDGANRAPDFPR